MPKATKVFYCPNCQRDVVSVKVDKKDTCNLCGGNVKVRCWSIRFRIYEGNKLVRKSITGCRTEKEANDSYLKFMASYKKPVAGVNSPIYKLTINDAYKIYLQTKASEVKQSTYYDNIKCFQTNVLPFFSGRLVTSITTKDVKDWQDYLVSKNYAYKTKSKNRGYFNNFFDFLSKEYNIDNVVARVKGFSKKLENIKQKEMQIIEPDEYKALENSIEIDNIEDRTLFNILYLCQTRKGECCALTWNDWLRDKTKIDINKTFSRISMDADTHEKYPVPKTDILKEFNVGTRSKYIVYSPKSANGVRKVDLPQSTIDYLTQLYEIKSKVDGFSNDDFIFGKHNSFLNYTTLSNHFEKYKKMAGITKKVRVHDLRHSGVSMLINTYQNSSSNINTLQLEFVIAERIGDNVEQVIHTYGHLFKGVQSAIANSIKL